MKTKVAECLVRSAMLTCLPLVLDSCSNARKVRSDITDRSGIYSDEELKKMITKPVAMGGYLPSQSGPLMKPDGKGGFTYDSTFTVEKIKVPSEGLTINGWLYLPSGDKKCPLVILTNGG